jgi:hypothetical protein
LQQPLEEFLPSKPVAVEIFIDLGKVASLPKMHQAVDAIDKGHRFASRRLVAERAALALRPCLELDLIAGLFLSIGISFRIGIAFFVFGFIG